MPIYMYFCPSRASVVGYLRQAKVRITVNTFFINGIHSNVAMQT